MTLFRVYTSNRERISDQYSDLKSRLVGENHFFNRNGNRLIVYESLVNRDKVEGVHLDNFNVMDAFMGRHSSKILASFLKRLTPFFGYYLKEKNADYQVFMRKNLELMFLFAQFNYGSLKSGMLSYCSHSEGYFTKFNERQLIKNKFETNFKINFGNIVTILDDTLLFKNLDRQLFLKDIINSTKLELKEKVLNGDINFLNLDRDLVNEDSVLLKSPFHKKMGKNKEFINYMANNTEFLTKRFLTILQYMFLKNIGLSSRERYYFCYLAYRTIEEKLSISALEEISK